MYVTYLVWWEKILLLWFPAGIGTLIHHRDWILTSDDMKTTLISDRYMYAISIDKKPTSIQHYILVVIFDGVVSTYFLCYHFNLFILHYVGAFHTNINFLNLQSD